MSVRPEVLVIRFVIISRVFIRRAEVASFLRGFLTSRFLPSPVILARRKAGRKHAVYRRDIGTGFRDEATQRNGRVSGTKQLTPWLLAASSHTFLHTPVSLFPICVFFSARARASLLYLGCPMLFRHGVD